MNQILQYLIIILAMGLLAGGWMAVQILAKRMNIKNHIDDASGCCGACAKRDECERKENVVKA